MKNKKYFIIWLIINTFLISNFAPINSNDNMGESYDTNPKTHNGTPPPYERVLLDRFLMPFDYVFAINNPSGRNLILDQIKVKGTEESDLFLTPFPIVFHLDHAPACFKWYVNAVGITYLDLPVSFPIDSYMEVTNLLTDTRKTVNGSEIRVEIAANFYFNYYIKVNLGHISLNQSLVDAWQLAPEIDVFGLQKKAIFIPANTTFGFILEEVGGVDYMVIDEHENNYPTIRGEEFILDHSVNPFNYFTEDVQNELLSYYQAQYDAMKESGMYCESTLNRTFNFNENGTLFGQWFYHDGPFNLTESHHGSSTWYRFDGAILNLMNINNTDRETFYKDKSTGENFTTNMIGVFGDSDFENIDGYPLIGGRYMYLEEGNFSAGILNLTEYFSNAYSPGSVFMKYSLEPSEDTMYDDLLRVEYFESLIEAQGSFTSNNVTYIRLYEVYDLWKPYSNEPLDASYEENALGKTINWTLLDNDEGSNYSVLLNGSSYVESSWQNGVNVAVPVNTSCTLGDWNYTILFNDTAGLWGDPDTVIITIYEGTGSDPNPSDPEPPGISFGLEFLLIALVCLPVIVYWKRSKIKIGLKSLEHNRTP